MAVYNNRLIAPQLLAATDTLLYTAPTGSRVKNIAYRLVNNDTTNAYGATIYHVPSGESVAATYNIAREGDFILPANGSVTLAPFQNLNAGDMIYAKADTASKLVIHASGTVEQ